MGVSTVKSRKIQIRPASESDAVALAKLRYVFRTEKCRIVELESDFVERCQLWMWERLRHPSPWRCWIAESEGRLVGNLWVQLIEKIPNPASEPEHHAYLTNLYVDDHYRGQGVGSQLMATTMQWLQTQAIHAVILWRTEASREFYARNGFSAPDNLMENLNERNGLT